MKFGGKILSQHVMIFGVIFELSFGAKIQNMEGWKDGAKIQILTWLIFGVKIQLYNFPIFARKLKLKRY